MGKAGGELKEKQIIGSLGLDDVHEKHIHEPIFGEKQSVKKTMTSAMNRSLIQYFAKIGRSTKDDEVVDLDYVEQFLANGADINCADKYGQTLLHEVCKLTKKKKAKKKTTTHTHA